MNWYLSSHPVTDLNAKIEDYKSIAAEVIENWIENVNPREDKSEGFMMELPPRLGNGAYWYSGVAYCYRFTTGFYDKKYGYVKLGQVPYNISIEREDRDTYAHEVGAEFARNHIRYIENAHAII